MRRYVFLPVLLLLLLAASLDCFAAENATITGDALNIREKPTTDAKVVGSLNKGTRIEALAHTDATDSIAGFTGYWYYIIYKGVYGYVFGKYVKIDIGVSIPSESDYRSTAPITPAGGRALLTDILGDWPMYFDAPNITFSFYPNMTAKFVESTFVGGGDRVVTYPPVLGTYTFDGRTITANWNDGTSGVFLVEKSYGVTTLTTNGVILPPELHMLAPGESLIND
ncbi:MAG: SH3 domain-containing protein [Deltaproteobacteria bacterium]|nr:SH3 domain-containing protein [Candidatus Zymogenaceae bacterium]